MTTWTAERNGRCWYVKTTTGEYLRGAPCNYGPTGRIISFRSEASAQRRADALNADSEIHTAPAPTTTPPVAPTL